MRVPRLLQRSQPVLLGIGFALLVGISAGTVWLVDHATRDTRRLAEALSFQDHLSTFLLNVRRAESSERGYLLTGEASYLDSFHQAEPALKELLKEMRALSTESPRRQALTDAAEQLAADKFAEMSQIISLYQRQENERVRSLLLSGKGRDIMNSLRELIESGIATERQNAAERSTRSRESNFLLLMLTMAGSALIVLIGAFSVWLVQRNTAEAAAARHELQLTNANLERIVDYRTADLTEANEEIQRFAYVVSHDLRSPLVNIMGFTSELEALRGDIFAQVARLKAELAALNAKADAQAEAAISQLGEDFDEAIRFIKTSIGNMDRLINAVLKLSREGRRQFNPETIDMNAVIETIVQTVNHRASEQGATLRTRDLPPVESDRLAIDQIFGNLIDNALKYGRPEEPLRIEIDGRTKGAQVVYEIKDNGRGIDRADHQRIFELFRRSGVQDRPGEGIGLAHVRALVRRLGGKMSLTSELGKGSTFTVTLPRRWSVEKRSVA